MHPACVYVERILGVEQSSSGLAHELRSLPGRGSGYRDIIEGALGDDVVGNLTNYGTAVRYGRGQYSTEYDRGDGVRLPIRQDSRDHLLPIQSESPSLPAASTSVSV